MAVTSMIKSLTPVSVLVALLYAPPGLLEKYLRNSPTKIALLKKIRPLLKFLIGFGIARTVNRALNSLATNNWRISSSPPTQPWDWPHEIAVVTGGCGGIGLALVQGLTARGVRVAVLDIIAPPPAITSNSNAFYFECDITSLEKVTETADAIRKTLGGDPSVLVNNAGIARFNPILEASEKSLQQVLAVNLMALWFTTKQFLPAMIKADKGHIVTVASLASYGQLPNSVEYSSSKAGALAFHEGLTCEIKHLHRAYGVKTTSVHPNFVRTPMTQPHADRIERRQKMLTVEDIAGPVLAQIFSGRGGQLLMPESQSFVAGMRGWPNWIQEAFRDLYSKDSFE